MIGNGRDCPERAAGGERRAARATWPPGKRCDDEQAAMPPAWLKLRGAQFHLLIQRPSLDNPFGAGGSWRMASLLVSHCVPSTAPSSRLALRQNPLRHGRCRS